MHKLKSQLWWHLPIFSRSRQIYLKLPVMSEENLRLKFSWVEASDEGEDEKERGEGGREDSERWGGGGERGGKGAYHRHAQRAAQRPVECARRSKLGQPLVSPQPHSRSDRWPSALCCSEKEKIRWITHFSSLFRLFILACHVVSFWPMINYFLIFKLNKKQKMLKVIFKYSLERFASAGGQFPRSPDRHRWLSRVKPLHQPCRRSPASIPSQKTSAIFQCQISVVSKTTKKLSLKLTTFSMVHVFYRGSVARYFTLQCS